MTFDFCSQLVDPGESSTEFEKVGRDVVKISDNQAFHSLIIKTFDNQTVTLS
jgi:hypothetical protein